MGKDEARQVRIHLATQYASIGDPSQSVNSPPRQLMMSVSASPTGRDLAGFHGTIPKTMRRKRRQNMADTTCQMFCGRRLLEPRPGLVKLGSGTLEIDAVTWQCLFQSKTIADLAIAKEMRASLRKNLARNRNPMAVLTGAQLVVKLSFSVLP